MMNATFADLIRRIQYLTHSPDKTPVEVQELEFYKYLYKILGQSFQSDFIENIIPFELKDFSFETVQSLVHPLGLHLVSGGSGIIYLSWSKGLDVN